MKAYEKRLRQACRLSDHWGLKVCDDVLSEDLAKLLEDVAQMRSYIETYGVHGKFCQRDGKNCVTCEVLKPKRGSK